MIVHRAEWLLPITRPALRRGWVAIEHGRIAAAGGAEIDPPAHAAAAAPIFDRCAILPGLVNAHTHLEVSWMRGRIAPSPSMPEWVEQLVALRRTVASDPRDAIAEAIAEARRSGTALVGDVSNTLASYQPLLESGMAGCVFHEVLGFNVADPGRVVFEAGAAVRGLTRASRLRVSIVPHAPYSVSPALLRAVAAASREDVVSIHVGESAEEMELLRSGTGRWRDLLNRLGAWNASWQAPGCGPVVYLDGFGLVNERLLAVHAVQLADAELDRLARAGATIVACPRSNRWTGAGVPPIARFYASGARVAVGTDSLASVEDLNVFNELQAMRRIAPEVPARTLLESATIHGAAALGFGDELGSIDPGKRADLIAVRVPPGVEDVEEYLVGGVDPADIQWLERDPWNPGTPEPLNP